MKHNSHTRFLSILISIVSVVGVTSSINAQTIRQDWHKNMPVFPAADQYSTRVVVDTNGNAYWAVNNRDSVVGLNYVIFEKLDTFGQLQFAITYLGYFGAKFTDLKIDEEGNTYLYGVNYGGSADQSNTIFLNKYDTSGSELWSTNFDYDVAGEEVPDQISISPMNGDIIATGSEYSPQQLLLGRFTMDGDLVWQHSFGSYEAGDILIDNTDRIHLVTTYHFLPGDSGQHFAYLLLNSDGSIFNGFTQVGGTYSYALHTEGKGRTVGIDADGNFYCLSWVHNFPFDTTTWTSVMLYKFSDSGNEIWSKRLEPYHYGYSEEQSTLLVDFATGGTLVVSGRGIWRYQTGGGFLGGYFTRHRTFVDATMYNPEKTFALSSGNPLSTTDSGKISHFDWSSIDTPVYVHGRANIQFLNNTAIAEADSAHSAIYVTWSYIGKASIHRLVVRDTLNTLVNEIADVNNKVDVYPNPASNYVHVVLNNNSRKEIVINVLDLTERMIITKSFQQPTNVELSVGDLSAGMYQIIIEQGSDRYVRKLIVE